MAEVDVIVPVYKGRPETLRCLLSVLNSIDKTPYELVVINDCSPDAELVADLQRLSVHGLFSLLGNDRNRGFVQTVNRGMRLHPDRDVVLLNSDTEVYGDWLDRLRHAARRNERTGTVTPLSNNATICSYPNFLHDNPYPLELSYVSLDELAAEANAGMEVEVPTAVGFCMYIRRDCLKEVGHFDEDAFGKGYGEENDFCQRAIAKQWRNVVAADVFVRHWGSASFQGERAHRVQAALKVLDKRHPNYQKDVRYFIEHDPLAAARRRLDWARLKQQVRSENVLIVCHNRGGGAERHVREDTRELLQSGLGVFYLRPQRGRLSHAYLAHPICASLPNLEKFRLADTDVLAVALGDLGITRIHVHGLVDFSSDAPRHLSELARSLGVPLWVDIHDYKVICPRVNLADRKGRYCGEPTEESGCNTCLATEGNDFGVHNIRDWRAMHFKVLQSAEKIFVPDQDVADRLGKYYPGLNYLITPHEEIDLAEVAIRNPEVGADEPLRIVVIGAIGKIKGYEVLLDCARDAQRRRLPLEFSVLGYSLDDRLLEQAGVMVTGRYLEREASEKLHALSPHAVWLPSLWPETYSYTLSLALKAGCPVFAFDIGAIARRLREVGKGDTLLPLSFAGHADSVNEKFLNFRQACSHEKI
jgi:GT2 family glycosyltransferase/glycosyltransferase involved in cell wall biosynthesis